jgi:hypothetical protein
MPAIYDNSDVRFLYPENWVLTEEEKEDWPRSLSVQSPASGFWSLHIYPSRQNPNQLAKDAVAAWREAYGDVEAEEVYEKIGPADALGYNIDFIYLDFIVRAEVRSFSVGTRSFVVLCQAETREFDQLANVFRAITMSMLQS